MDHTPSVNAITHFCVWFFLLRMRKLGGDDKDISNYLHDAVGQTLILTEVIRNHSGRIRFKGSWWQAYCKTNANLELGIKVQVVKIEGTIVYIEPLEGE